jgi:phage-related protein
VAITVEELQIIISVETKKAIAQMKQFKSEMQQSLNDVQKPMKQLEAASEKAKTAIVKSNTAIGKANDAIAKSADAPLEKIKKTRQSAEEIAKLVDDAVKRANAASGSVSDGGPLHPPTKYTDAYASMYDDIRQAVNDVANSAQKPVESAKKVKQTYEDVAKLIDEAVARATTPISTGDDGPLYSPKKYTNAYANKKVSAEPQQPRAPDLSLWERVTAQINAKLDFVKQKLASIGLYGKEAGEKISFGMKSAANASEKAASSVKKVSDHARSAGSGASYLGRMLKSMVVSMLFFQGMSAIFGGVSEGMQNMAQASSAANATLSSVSSSFLYLKNSLAAALMPALQALVPLITTVTNALASLFNMIGAVTSAVFGGAATFVKAKKVQVDYAASLGKTGAAAKKAGQDAKGALASFDELNVIGNQAGGADAGGGGAGGIDPGTMFEEVEIPEGAQALADKIRTMFAQLKEAAQPTIEALGRLKDALEPLKTFTFTALQDFYNNFLIPVGSWMLGEGLPRLIDALANGLMAINWQAINDALNTLWDALKPFTINVGEGLLWFWENVLVPLGTWTMNNVVPLFLEILSAAINVLNSVIEALKPLGQWLWESFLQPLAEWTGGIIVSVLQNIRDGLNGLSEWVNEHQEAVQTMAIIAGSFAAAWVLVNSAIKSWNVVGTVAKAVTSGFSAAIAFITSPIGIAVLAIGALIAIGVLIAKNWEEIKTKAIEIWTAIKDFFTETIPKIISDIVKWFSELPDKIAYAIGFVLGKIVLWASNVISTAKTEVPKIIAAIIKFFTELPGKIYNAAITVKEKIVTWAGDVKGWFANELPKVITSVVQFFKDLPQKIYDGITELKSKIVDIGKYILDGIFEGLSNIGKKISGWKDSFVRGFKDALGIASPSRVMRDEVGVFISAGIAEGIRKNLGLVTSAAQDVADSVQKVFDGITYNPSIDYAELMNAAEAAGDYEKAAELEKQRNAKIKGEGLQYSTTDRYSEHMADTMDSVLASVSGTFVEQQKSNEQQAGFYDSSANTFERIVASINDVLGVMRNSVETFQKAVSEHSTAVTTAMRNMNTVLCGKLDVLTSAVRNIRINIVNNYYSSGTEKPRLASGAVLRSETEFVGGEYPGASSNPEIVSPRSIMSETFNESIWPLIDTMVEYGEKLLNAIDQKDTNVYIDKTKISREIRPTLKKLDKYRGKSLVSN